MQALRISLLLIMASLMLLSCDEDQDPQTLSTNRVEGIWGIDEGSVRVQGLTLEELYNVAGVPVEDRPDWSTLRIAFSSGGLYTIQNVELIGFQSQGTWQVVEGENKILMNPGNVEVVVSEFSNTSMKIAYSFSTAGTAFSGLGGRATVSGTLIK